MLSPDIYAALAHERHQTFLAQAEAYWRARQARLHRRQAGITGARRSPRRRRPAWLQPSWSRLLGYGPRSGLTGRPVVLRDGSAVLIRPVHSADASLLADGFARLSARSRQPRFLTPKQELSPAGSRARHRTGFVMSAGNRMKAAVRWAGWLMVLRGCDGSAAKGQRAPRRTGSRGVGK